MINISIKKPKPVLVMVHNASKGLRGVGLSGVTLDKDGNLIFTMSDGTVQTIKGYSQDLVNTTNEINNIKEEVSTIANNAADSAKEAKETADSIKQEYDRVEGATNSGLALIERSVLYGINRVKEATKACKSDALANIELAHKDAIDDIAIRRLEALQDIAGANAAAVSSAAAAKTSETNAETSNQMAKKWAESTESPDGATDSDSSTGNTQSSKSWALHSKSNASAAKVSETNAKTSETNAGASATTAKNWAVSETSPDGATDTSSGTGKTQSSRTWALESKASAQSASSSANTATTQASSATASAKSASTSATSASDSATSAASSATAAKNSAIAAASSASSASTSATNAKAAMNTANTAASSASTSATNASTSASNASKSEIAAKTAQAAAEKARDDANSAVTKITGAMKYAGQVDNYSDLSDVTKNTGDVWNIVNADPEHGIKAGDNVAWNGTDWDDLSGTVDLSIYAEKADYQKAITSATANGATITFNHKDGTTSTATVNNVASATAATNDAKGQKIDTTYEKIADASNVHTSLQNSINSLSTGKQDKLTFDTTPITGSSNPVTSGGIKTALDTKLNKTDAANTYLDKLSKTEQVVTAPIKGTLNGNASSATKLATARTINVTDADGTNTGTGASFNGTNNATIKLPQNIRLYGLAFPNVDYEIGPSGKDGQKTFSILAHTDGFHYSRIQLSPKINGNGSGYIDIVSDNGKDSSRLLLTPTGASYDKTLKTTIDGNASSATKLANARTINVQDASASNTGTGASFDGSGNATIKLPAKIKATLTGNADTATKATNDGNGNPIASTYLPLSGGTMTGRLQSGVVAVPIELLTTGTSDRTIQTFSTDGNHRIGLIRMGKDSSNNCQVIIGASNTSNAAPSGITITRGTSGDSVITGITPPAGDNSTKIATTAFVNAKAGNYLSLSGGTMTGDINMAKHNLIGGHNTGIYCAGNDNGGTLGTTGSNINIKSWYGVGFINGCSDSHTHNKVTVGIDVRTGTLQAHHLVATDSIQAPNIYTKSEVDNKIATDGMPTGTVLAFAGNTIPKNYLLCNGSAVSRSTYANLFNVIGTTYGAGDGSTTFNLPNLVDRFVEGGSASGAMKNAGLPNITGTLKGTLTCHEYDINGSSEIFPTFLQELNVYADQYIKATVDIPFNANSMNSIYGSSSTVQPPAIVMKYIIKI